MTWRTSSTSPVRSSRDRSDMRNSPTLFEPILQLRSTGLFSEAGFFLQTADSHCQTRIAADFGPSYRRPPHPGEFFMSKREQHPKPVLGGHESVKIAIAQIPAAFLDRKKTIARACSAVREAAQNGASLIVFPEVWVSGYPFWSEGWDTQIPAWIDA